jgi:bifunctional DNA-binding transcriptional regulator/antitoxin component of YhaV-PrlF toxin-antitoxin module
MDLLGEDPGGLEEARRRREQHSESLNSQRMFDEQQDEEFIQQLRSNPRMEGSDTEDPVATFNPPSQSTSLPTPPISIAKEDIAPSMDGFDKVNLKLANYGYASDSSPDYNSNVLKIGHANNKLEDGVSAALTKSLAKRYGLKTGDMFEVVTADGKVMQRRYDDTVPTTYKGKKLPETVDLYEETKGSNNFGGKVVGIRKLGKPDPRKLDLAAGSGDISEYDNPILPRR